MRMNSRTQVPLSISISAILRTFPRRPFERRIARRSLSSRLRTASRTTYHPSLSTHTRASKTIQMKYLYQYRIVVTNESLFKEIQIQICRAKLSTTI